MNNIQESRKQTQTSQRHAPKQFTCKIGKSKKLPVEKHLERENEGERWVLDEEESLSALAVEEAHILRAIAIFL